MDGFYVEIRVGVYAFSYKTNIAYTQGSSKFLYSNIPMPVSRAGKTSSDFS